MKKLEYSFISLEVETLEGTLKHRFKSNNLQGMRTFLFQTKVDSHYRRRGWLFLLRLKVPSMNILKQT